ncbi:hypothetical protein L208DRAFT_1423363 [Tricholoma matsutake]|nr:hypothetical protein L208DRAFT_1423363 [Tricholoma matsutake 945]
MPTYYPSQGSHYSHHAPPVVYTSSSHGHSSHGHGDYYPQPPNPGVIYSYAPSHSSRRSSSRHRHHHHHHRQPPRVVTTAPVMMQPSTHHSSYHHGGHPYYDVSFGERVRRFFGLAPRGPFKYKSNKGSWGFLGWSRRPRYADAATGVEVDRKGRPIYRV